jgi:hypothetical protein
MTTGARFWPSHTVRLAVRTLPPGAVRDRYRQEFMAELHDLTGSRQSRHALGILTRSIALRSALTTDRPTLAEAVITMSTTRKPLLCRTHLHHRWAIQMNPEGESYLRCGRCGNDLYDVERSTRPNVGGNLMGLHGGV